MEHRGGLGGDCHCEGSAAELSWALNKTNSSWVSLLAPTGRPQDRFEHATSTDERCTDSWEEAVAISEVEGVEESRLPSGLVVDRT